MMGIPSFHSSLLTPHSSLLTPYSLLQTPYSFAHYSLFLTRYYTTDFYYSLLTTPNSQLVISAALKEVDARGMVSKTLDRSKLWEVQTPQIIRPELLRKGYDKVGK